MGCLDDLEKELNIKPLLFNTYTKADEDSYENYFSYESSETTKEIIKECAESNYEYVAKELKLPKNIGISKLMYQKNLN